MTHPRFLLDLTHCPLRRALDTLGERWTLLLLREAIYGVRRFDDFARALGCGRGVLSARLKALTDDGILERKAYIETGQRPREEYCITEKGRELFPAILALSQWSERWNPPPDGPLSVVTETASGRPVRALITSDPKVTALSMPDLQIAPGPGAKPLKAR